MGSRSSKSRRSKSSRSRNPSSRSSVKDRATEEKIRVAELIAESSFTEQKLKMEYKATRLEMEHKVAKVQARAKSLDLLDMRPLEGQGDAKDSQAGAEDLGSFVYAPLEVEEDAKGKNIAHNNQMADPNIALDKPYENQKEFNPGNKYHYSDSLFRNGEPNYTSSDHNNQAGEVSKRCVSYLSSKGY